MAAPQTVRYNFWAINYARAAAGSGKGAVARTIWCGAKGFPDWRPAGEVFDDIARGGATRP